ncbi:MAG: hypothetical protein K2X10_06865 [Hyphomicrobiales bacterium]|nr:hypothetical protein [Hyphomicrobiales bacterium]
MRLRVPDQSRRLTGRLCHVLAAIIALAGVTLDRAQAADMEFRWVSLGADGRCGRVPCPRVLEAVGAISHDTPAEFRRFVEREGNEPGARRAVLLHSPGGDLAASMRLGIEFRRLGMIVYVGRFVNAQTLEAHGLLTQGRTAKKEREQWGDAHPVNGICYSACVFTFMGGVKRMVPQTSRLGVHRPTLIEETFFGIPLFDRKKPGGWDINRIGDLERTYLRFMGANPQLVALAHSVEPTMIRVLSPRELKRFRLVTR